jgi:hypothetical protein
MSNSSLLQTYDEMVMFLRHSKNHLLLQLGGYQFRPAGPHYRTVQSKSVHPTVKHVAEL